MVVPYPQFHGTPHPMIGSCGGQRLSPLASVQDNFERPLQLEFTIGKAKASAAVAFYFNTSLCSILLSPFPYCIVPESIPQYIFCRQISVSNLFPENPT